MIWKKHSSFAKRLLLTGLAGLVVGLANAADTIKVGALHSLSGAMAISETTLKDTVLMLVEEQNEKGGLLGKQ
jgi:urea transport system substrate-binding protein